MSSTGYTGVAAWRQWRTVTGDEVLTSLTARYKAAGDTFALTQQSVAAPPVRFNVLPGYTDTLLPRTLRFTFGNDTFEDLAGTGVLVRAGGIPAGTVNYASGAVELTDYTGGSNTFTVLRLGTRRGEWLTDSVLFRTPGSPLRPASFSVQASDADGNLLTAAADVNGLLEAPGIHGDVNTSTGVVRIAFGDWVADTSLTAAEKSEAWYDPANIDAQGDIFRPAGVIPETVRYNAVILSPLPLDADLLGLDPVRLPPDGKVPIFQLAGVAVLHHTDTTAMPSPLTAGQVVTAGRTDLSLVWLTDADGDVVDPAKYTADLATGDVTMANPLDLTGYTEPLTIHHRVEDMLLVTDVDIDGRLGVSGGASRAYTAGVSYMSSALIFGDLQARVTNLHDMAAWDAVTWQDTPIGSEASASYDSVTFPPTVDNRGAIEERWALDFTSSTSGNIIGETLGIIGQFSTATDVAPNNPNTGTPYFVIQQEGFGSGWQAGNVVRFNTKAAAAPIWYARTTLPGEATSPDDSFRTQLRGDAD